MSGKLVTGKHALVRPFFQDGKDKRYSYVYIRILYTCIFFLLAVLEVKNVQEHASLLHLLAMSKINKLLAQELGTATCLIARRIHAVKTNLQINANAGTKSKDACLQLSITTHSPKKGMTVEIGCKDQVMICHVLVVILGTAEAAAKFKMDTFQDLKFLELRYSDNQAEGKFEISRLQRQHL